MKENFRSLAEAIRFWIVENHYNLKGAAGILGVSLAELHNVLKGKSPKRETLYRLAKQIGISDTHAFILAELNRAETPDRIKELLWFFYEKTIDVPEVSVAEVIGELYPTLKMSATELEKEERLLKNMLTMLLRLKWTTEYWNIAHETIRQLVALQDEHILQWSSLGREEALGVPHNLEEIFRQLARDERKGVKVFYLDRKESPRGYVMSAVSIPAGYGAFEFGTATTYGFEMGLVIKGEGMFFSKGVRKDETYTVQPFKEMTAISFSRHRSHCIFVTKGTMEILNIQIPFSSGKFTKLPISFRRSPGKNKIITTPTLLFTNGKRGRRFRVREFRAETQRLPAEVEELLLAVDQQNHD